MATNCSSRFKDPKFMKVVLNPDEHRLKIPTEYVKRYGNSLPNIISLKVPTGSLWRVELTHIDGEIWMQKGLKEFKEYYSIGFGHSLVFKYQGNDEFFVVIFDRTSSEIEYPFECATSYGIGSEYTDCPVSSKEVPVSKKCKGKGIKVEELAIDESESGSDASVEIIDSPWASNGERRKRVRGVDNHPMTKKKTSPERWSGKKYLQKEKSVAYERAKCYKDDNPSANPYFISLMHPSHVRGCDMSIPMHIAKGNLSDKTSNLKLRVSSDKTWPVKCTIHKLTPKIHGGWNNFVKDNRLKVGDVCIFEVVNKDSELILDVIIFRS